MKPEMQEALVSWRRLNEALSTFNEPQLKIMLDHELEHSRRTDVAVRLHQRYAMLRNKREREELQELLK